MSTMSILFVETARRRYEDILNFYHSDLDVIKRVITEIVTEKLEYRGHQCKAWTSDDSWKSYLQSQYANEDGMVKRSTVEAQAVADTHRAIRNRAARF